MAEKELKPDFKAEYAKSNRSSCKGCSDKLEKDLVRIGKLERAANFDGEIYVWFHPRCFFNKHGGLVKDVNDIKGLTDLRWDDQQTLKKFVGGGGDDEDEDMDDDNIEGVVVEYAKSGRSTCKSCYKTIANKELRVGEQYRDEDNGYSGTNWYHLTCFTVPDSVESVKDLDGYSKLKPADKKLVEAHFTAAFKTNSKKRKEREDDMEERAAKRQKTDDAERQRVEQLWKIKDKLKKKYNTNELKAILKFNDQSYHGGPQELIDRVADGELNGALPLCSECKKGHLYLDAGQIKCHGYLSAWSKCTFTCPPADIKERAKWKYPKDDDMDELIEKIKEDKNKDKAPGVTISHPELFNDLLFAFVGDVTNKDTLTESITQRGGQVNANVVKKVTHVISTYDEVSKAKHTTKIANAVKWDIPILSSGFINKSIEDGNLNSLEDFKLWKDDKAVQVDDKYQAAAATNSGPKQRKKLAIPPVDEKCSLATGGQILVEGTDVYATMLNMTDLTQGQSGRNSFYLMMIVTNAKKSKFILFRKWGRVGQEDAPTTEGEYTKGDAIAEFERIFYEKTKNTWDQFLEDTYEKKPGKFFPIELGGDEEEEVDDAKLKRAKEILQAGTTCKLDQRVQDLVKLLFDTNMFKEQMKEMKIDVKKMPLGKLSKTQLAKGVAVLEEIEQELNKDKPSSAFLLDASNRFYTVVPHDFGFDKPIPIDNKEFLQKKFDLIEILGDIEVAARMLEAEGKMGIDPITEQYNQLKNEIHPVEKDSEEWKRIQTFWDNTRENKNITIEEIYTVNRQGERELFTQHNKLDTRKLLWHGSKVAVFAAILSGGLKIMPHAGGRVGRGLYFADMISKSEQYLGLHGDIGLVLLNEVALGKIHRIQHDRPDLVKAPGANSAVLAEGSVHPDPKFDYEDKSLSPSGFPVLIPQGKVVNSGVRGSFMHNEFLVYDQTQASMRYLIKLRNKGRAGWW